MSPELEGKEDKDIFLYNNTRQHIARSLRTKLLDLGWIVISHRTQFSEIVLHC